MELVGQASGVQEYSYDYDDESYEYSDYMNDDEDNTEEDEEYYNYIDDEEDDYPGEDARDGKASAQHANIFSLPVQQPRSIFQLPRCHTLVSSSVVFQCPIFRIPQPLPRVPQIFAAPLQPPVAVLPRPQNQFR